MLTRIEVANFKSIAGCPINLRPLTIFSGLNGAGKSSFVQAILLARQAIRSPSGIAQLNGLDGFALGTVADIISSRHPNSDTISISIEVSGEPVSLAFSWRDENVRYLQLEAKTAEGKSDLHKCLERTQYLSAEREGPRESQPLTSVPFGYTDVGHAGQYAAQVIAGEDRSAILPKLEHPKGKGLSYFSRQVELWMGEIIPGIELRVEQAPEVSRIGVRFRLREIADEWLKPANVGFGISYCLPIFVACLSAKEGDLVIIDTPEAHLHPSAQSFLGRFLSLVASAGIQVIVETHSDHIINGVRLASIATMGAPSEDVLINHLSNTSSGVGCREIKILPDGELSARPPEFFDQFERDLVGLVRLRIGKTA